MIYLRCILFSFCGIFLVVPASASERGIGTSPFSYDIFVEYLFWNAREDNLEFALNYIDAPSIIAAANGIFPIDQKFNWDSGFRVGLDYYFSDCCLWDIEVALTWFQTRSRTRVSNLTGTLIATLPSFILPALGAALTADSSWFLHFYLLTLDIGYLFCPIGSLELRPHIGAIGVQTHQVQQVTYTYDSPFSKANVRRANDFVAAGPRIGIDLRWTFFSCLSLLSKINAAFAFGKFHSKDKFNLTTSSVAIAPSLDNPLFRGRPMGSIYLGLGWEKCICRHFLQICAGYEIQYWWQQWHAPAGQFNVGAGNSIWGDLLLHGLDVSLALSF